MATALDLEEIKTIETRIASGASIRSIARALKRSPETIRQFAKKPETQTVILALREKLAGQFEDVAIRSLTYISDKKLESSSASQLSVIAGIATDKSSGLRNLSPDSQPLVQINIRTEQSDYSKPIEILNGIIQKK